MPINGATQTYGIMGHPVRHSLSPAIHNGAFESLGLNKVYVAFDVNDVAGAMHGFRALGIGGLSVTIPHKQAVIPYLDAIDPVAEKIGAVNTLVMVDGSIKGYNTDWIGANQALEEKISLPGIKVLLLGAGGSARAIGFGLQEKGAEVILASRTPQKGKDLADELSCQWLPIDQAESVVADCLVNATSVGMAPDDNSTPYPAALEAFKVVMDIVYAPLKTRLLREAEEARCTTINGTNMLLYQAVAQFELWNAQQAPVAVMRQKLLEQLGVKQVS